MTLPGVGHATACAVLVYSFNAALAFIETNVRRVFLHFLFPGVEGVKDAQLLPFVEKALDRDNPREWYYALMDYGTMLARTTENPNRRSAHYTRQSEFEGSHRQTAWKDPRDSAVSPRRNEVSDSARNDLDHGKE